MAFLVLHYSSFYNHILYTLVRKLHPSCPSLSDILNTQVQEMFLSALLCNKIDIGYLHIPTCSTFPPFLIFTLCCGLLVLKTLTHSEDRICHRYCPYCKPSGLPLSSTLHTQRFPVARTWCKAPLLPTLQTRARRRVSLNRIGMPSHEVYWHSPYTTLPTFRAWTFPMPSLVTQPEYYIAKASKS